MNEYHSAERVQDSEGRQYHIGLAPGEVAPHILLAGDPARARRCAERFDQIDGEWANREYVTITGVHKGLPISVMATGIGCDNTEIALVELSALLEDATLIRIGTCGALQPDIGIGDLVVSWGSVRLENTSLQYVPEGYPAVAHPDVIQALRKAAGELGYPNHFGLTATASGFYGAQGRTVDHFPPRNPDLPDQLAAVGVKNLEMETSTLLTLATMRGFRAGAVCTVFADRGANKFVSPAQKLEYEGRVIDCGLAALHHLK